MSLSCWIVLFASITKISFFLSLIHSDFCFFSCLIVSLVLRLFLVIQSALTDENKNLQKILETEYFNKNLSNILLAKVLVDKNSPFLKSIIINKCSKEGIIKGMPVTQNKYLIGRIVETNYLSSRVWLLNDLNSRIPVTFDTSSTQAILTGHGTRKPTLE